MDNPKNIFQASSSQLQKEKQHHLHSQEASKMKAVDCTHQVIAGTVEMPTNEEVGISYSKCINIKDYIHNWEEKATAHFQKSAWQDVVIACKKVLAVPGQEQTNFNVLFQIGYAYMKLGDYDDASRSFNNAHQIDSRRRFLWKVMNELFYKMNPHLLGKEK